MTKLFIKIVFIIFFLFLYANGKSQINEKQKNVREEGIIGINTNFPTIGDSRLAVILVGFDDISFTLSNSAFDNLFNQEGYNQDGFIGSVKDYFHDISYGKMNLTVDVVGPYPLSNNRSFYGAHSGSSVDANTQTMASEAIGLADTHLNYSDYDNDGDGNVDGLYIIFAGNGEEAGGGDEAIWSHKSLLTNQIYKDGVYLKMYSCSPEFRGSSTKISGIGVICHEFLHACGLPDFYDTDYEGSGGEGQGLGNWAIMASGSHTNEGRTPPQISAYEKYALKWITPIELNTATSIVIPSLAVDTIAYRLSTESDDEYFLIENRQPIKWDKYLPSHGLLLYHVDKNIAGWSSNRVNAVPDEQGYNLLEADNSLTEAGEGDPFPGSLQKNKIDDTTYPSLRTNSEAPTGHGIYNIIEDFDTGLIYFDYLEGDNERVQDFKATLNADNSIDLSWQDGEEILLLYGEEAYTRTPDVSVTENTILKTGIQILSYDTSNGFSLDNLKDGTKYHFSIWAKNGDKFSTPVTTQTTTYPSLSPATTLPFNEDFESENWLNIWTAINAGGQSHQVWKRGFFSRGLSVQSNNNYAYLNSELYGSAGTQNASLISPLFDLTNYTNVDIRFTHYYKYIELADISFQYSTDGGNNWTEIAIWNESTENPETYEDDLSNEIAGKSNIRLRWLYTGSYGHHWSIDDILLTSDNLVDIDNPNKFDISIYPNPAKNYIYVDANQPFKIKITDACGKTVFVDYSYKEKARISLRNLKEGIYFVTVKSNEAVINKKIVKINKD